MTACGDLEKNFETCRDLAMQAASRGASMLFLPECFSFIGEREGESASVAESLDGPILTRYCDLAREFGMWLSLGGFQEDAGTKAPGRLFNTHVIVDGDGRVRASYRKIHLFDVDVPGGPILMESRSTAPGNAIVAVDSPIGRLGVTVCYDLRFPELYQRLRFDQGCEVLLVPSAFTCKTGEAHWEVLLRARAIENQCYVIAAAQAGVHNAKRQSYGHAMIVDPWGTVVTQLEDPEETGIAVCDIDRALLSSIRTRMPIEQHRRPGIYSIGAKNDVNRVNIMNEAISPYESPGLQALEQSSDKNDSKQAKM